MFERIDRFILDNAYKLTTLYLLILLAVFMYNYRTMLQQDIDSFNKVNCWNYYIGTIPNITQDNDSFNNLIHVHSWTKAICDYERNICTDYLIMCNGYNVLNITPISEPVYMGENWIDQRTNINELC